MQSKFHHRRATAQNKNSESDQTNPICICCPPSARWLLMPTRYARITPISPPILTKIPLSPVMYAKHVRLYLHPKRGKRKNFFRTRHYMLAAHHPAKCSKTCHTTNRARRNNFANSTALLVIKCNPLKTHNLNINKFSNPPLLERRSRSSPPRDLTISFRSTQITRGLDIQV